MKVLYVILVSYASAGLAQAVLLYAYRSKDAQKYMISDDAHRSKSDRELYWRVALNIGVSITLIFSVMFGLGKYLYYDHAVSVWRYVLEAVTVVLLYDFGYYFMHRYPFHEWKILRGVHSVHHAARNPRQIDSLLLHPVETILGLGLFFGSVARSSPCTPRSTFSIMRASTSRTSLSKPWVSSQRSTIGTITACSRATMRRLRRCQTSSSALWSNS